MQLVGAAVHQDDRSDDHGGSECDPQRQRFAGIGPTQQNGDNRVDISVGGHRRGRIVLQQPVIGSERDHRTEQNEIAESQPRFYGDTGKRKPFGLTCQCSSQEQHGRSREKRESGEK